ncbi:hypothetical protein QE152_g26370 [Popillia japonica]|uniref:Uncharacterized protein n=1 Tax=Popillia japonica TaxID=7064 RepID=A0AAW1JYH9_POPJA
MALLGNMPEFVPTGDFNIYKERLEQYFIANGISDEKKVAVIITTLHSSVYTTLRDLCHPDVPSTKTGKILDRMCEEDPSKKTLEDVVEIAIKKEASLKLSTVDAATKELHLLKRSSVKEQYQTNNQRNSHGWKKKVSQEDAASSRSEKHL